MAIKTVGVLGCGLMGAGIAQVSAAAGYKTIVREVNERRAQEGPRPHREVPDRRRRRRARSPRRQKTTTLGNLTGTTSYDDLKDCDLVIEAIIENVEARSRPTRRSRRSSAPHCLIASNTSSLCITELAAATKRPDRFGGLHFFNPVPLMKLVEVIRALTTSEETLRRAVRVRAGARQGADHRARQAAASSSTACWCRICSTRSAAYEDGLGTVEDIDKGMKLGCGYPMGPFTLLDFVGLDTTYYIANIMFEEFREPRFAPPPLLKRMVLAGHLGQEVRPGLLRRTRRRRRGRRSATRAWTFEQLVRYCAASRAAASPAP